MKILENIASKISDIAFNNFYQIYLPRQEKQKKKIKQMGLHQTKKFCTAKEIINKIKRQPTGWENIFADTSDKGLIFKIYKELIQLNTKKSKQPN